MDETREDYCNHDAPAVHEGVCECGEVVDPMTADLAEMLSGDDLSMAEIAEEMTAAVLGRLHDVASDYERETLDELAKRAGLRWHCPACGWINVERDTSCDSCRRERGDEDEED